MRLRTPLLGALYLGLVSCDNQRDVHVGSIPNAPIQGEGGSSACVGSDCTTRVFVDPSAPADAPDVFGNAGTQSAGTSPDREPTLVYPSDETRLPINLNQLRFEWEPGQKNSIFELSLRGTKGEVRVYTSASSFVTSESVWQAIAQITSTTAPIRVRVRGLARDADKRAFSTGETTISLGPALGEGPIHYWSTTARGILRTRLADKRPQRLKSEPADACAGCHALSRDGTRLALDAGEGYLKLIDLSSLEPQRVPIKLSPAPMPMPMPMPGKMDKINAETPTVWSAFSQDNRWLLLARNGTFSLVDGLTGAAIPTDPVALPAKTTATHPDWSPTGDRVAFTLAERGKGRAIERGSIAIMPFDGTRFGPIETLVPAAGGDDNNFFPAFSPDGKFIAYVNARGKSDNASSANIRLLRLEDRRSFDLPRLNARVNGGSAMDVGNTMPTWALSADNNQLWLSFSSLRAYAKVRPKDKKLDQLWLAAVDPALEDPALPAFWAPFQNLAHGNHRAFWSPQDTGSRCGCLEICGDGADNDCDGSTDEADCSVCAEREVCDDGIDNDCDCVIDDCSVEICDDGVDNDGDDFVDAADLSCGKP